MVDVEKALANRGPLYAHTVTLWLSEAEWGNAKADANEIGIDVADMLSLVVALASIGAWSQASCLALVDVYQIPRHR